LFFGGWLDGIGRYRFGRSATKLGIGSKFDPQRLLTLRKSVRVSARPGGPLQAVRQAHQAPVAAASAWPTQAISAPMGDFRR
jgi:hypothetical protein